MKLTRIHLLLTIMAVLPLQARTIYLTRHGQQGDRDYYEDSVQEMKLTPLGTEQAALLAHYLQGTCQFNGTILVSPLYRTIETGLPTARLLGKKMVLEPGLQEVSPGQTRPRAMSFAEIEERFPGMTVKGPAFVEPWRVFGEASGARKQRVEEAIVRILAENEGDLLLVTHGGILVDLTNYFFSRLPEGKKVSRAFWNCCLYIIELDDNNQPVDARFTTEYLPEDKVTNNMTPKIKPAEAAK